MLQFNGGEWRNDYEGIIIPGTGEEVPEITVSPLENEKFQIERGGDFAYIGDKAGQVVSAGIYEAQEFIMRQHPSIYPFGSCQTETGQNCLVLFPDVDLSLQPAFGKKINATLPTAALPA